MILDGKINCNTCGAFIGLIRGHDYPSTDDLPECCKQTMIDDAGRDLYKPSGNHGHRQSREPGVDEDGGPWGENAIRAMEDNG